MAQVDFDFPLPPRQVSPALGLLKTRSWFKHMGALLEALLSEPCMATADDLKKHLIAIKQGFSSSSEPFLLAAQQVDRLFRKVVSHKCPAVRVQELFSSKEAGQLLPDVAGPRKNASLSRQFIRDWVVPSMFKHYPGLEAAGESNALKAWTAHALLLTLSSNELERLKDQVDGLPPGLFTANRVGLKHIFLKQ